MSTIDSTIAAFAVTLGDAFQAYEAVVAAQTVAANDAAAAAAAAAIAANDAQDAADLAAAGAVPTSYKVTDFAPVGDGVTNDTVALQAAIDFCAAAKVPLIFDADYVYLVDYLDIPDYMVIKGRAQFASSGYDIKVNLPARRSVVYVGKHVKFEDIEIQPSSQSNYVNDPLAVDYGTGCPCNLFIDDYAEGNEIEVVATSAGGNNAVLITGHYQNIGKLSSYRARATPAAPLVLSTASTAWQRPFIIEGSYSQDGERIDNPEYDPNVGNIGRGMRIGSYDIRFYTRGFAMYYFDDFSFGPGKITGRHALATTDPGKNGILMGGLRDGVWADMEVSDAAEHGIRIASQNRRGCRNLHFGVITSKRCAPSVFKVNGGGGANVLGSGTGAANHDNKLTRTENISVAGLKVVDPFIKALLGIDDGGKAKDLLRLSHIQSFYCGFIQIDHTDEFYGSGGNQVTGEPYGDKPTGNILVLNSAQGVFVGPVTSSTNAQRSMRKMRIDATTDTDNYDVLADVRNIHLHGWTMPHDVADMDAYCYINTTAADPSINNIKVGDIRFTNALFQGSAPLTKIGNFSGTPTGRISFHGVVQDAATVSWLYPGTNYAHVVNFFNEAGGTVTQGNAGVVL